MVALETDLLDKIMALVEQWPQYYGSVTRALAEELVPKGLCLNPAGEYLACAFCRGRAGNRWSLPLMPACSITICDNRGPAGTGTTSQEGAAGASKRHRNRHGRRPKPEG